VEPGRYPDDFLAGGERNVLHERREDQQCLLRERERGRKALMQSGRGGTSLRASYNRSLGA